MYISMCTSLMFPSLTFSHKAKQKHMLFFFSRANPYVFLVLSDHKGENAHAGLLTGILDGLNFTIKEEAAKDPAPRKNWPHFYQGAPIHGLVNIPMGPIWVGVSIKDESCR